MTGLAIVATIFNYLPHFSHSRQVLWLVKIPQCFSALLRSRMLWLSREDKQNAFLHSKLEYQVVLPHLRSLFSWFSTLANATKAHRRCLGLVSVDLADSCYLYPHCTVHLKLYRVEMMWCASREFSSKAPLLTTARDALLNNTLFWTFVYLLSSRMAQKWELHPSPLLLWLWEDVHLDITLIRVITCSQAMESLWYPLACNHSFCMLTPTLC